MTTFNDQASTPEEAVVTAFEVLAPRLYLGPKAANEAAALMYETVEIAGPGDYQHLVQSFQNMHRSERLRNPEGFRKFDSSPARRRLVGKELVRQSRESTEDVTCFEVEITLEWLELSGTDHDLRDALGHILRLMRQGTSYEAAAELYGIRGHSYFLELWPVRRPVD